MTTYLNTKVDAFIKFMNNNNEQLYTNVSEAPKDFGQDSRTVAMTVNTQYIKRYTELANEVRSEIASKPISAKQTKDLKEAHEKYSNTFKEILRPAPKTTTITAPEPVRPKDGFESHPLFFIALLLLGLLTACIGIYAYALMDSNQSPPTLTTDQAVSEFTRNISEPAELANKQLTAALNSQLATH